MAQASATLEPELGRRSVGSTVRAYVTLTKPRVLELLLVSCPRGAHLRAAANDRTASAWRRLARLPQFRRLRYRIHECRL